MPEILADGDSITFRIDIADVGPGEQLIIRCESNGTVWVAIPDNTHSPEE